MLKPFLLSKTFLLLLQLRIKKALHFFKTLSTVSTAVVKELEVHFHFEIKWIDVK